MTASGPEGGSGAADLATLEHLRAELDDDSGDFIAQMVHLYLEQAAGLLDRMATAAEVGDDGGLSKAAHALRGSSLGVGGNYLAALCHELELGLAERKVSARDLIGTVGRVRHEYSALSDTLTSYLFNIVGARENVEKLR